ncbi:chitin deacetylase [Fusarium flagelliforme]|uniref:Chitin deacetylase n=1 Tax=Fusarium flagelliforme TaxID=2675880 RepID=A0A395MR18_9HYPO|nr:chitin deacetylase [Fusarium flagelliforme]
MRSLLFVALSGMQLASALSSPSNIPVGTVIQSCTQPDTIALTFDDGPFAYTENLLDQLLSAGMKATFFVNGKNWGDIKDYSSTVTRMLKDGHQIGSHTYSHPDMATISAATVKTEMTKLEDELVGIVGKFPTYMRPPYFSSNNVSLSVLGQLGYHVINADIDTNDWKHNTNTTFPEAVKEFGQGLAAGGSIVLMHDVHKNTVENIVPRIIDAVLESGKKAVTVGECLGDPEANWYRSSRS